MHPPRRQVRVSCLLLAFLVKDDEAALRWFTADLGCATRAGSKQTRGFGRERSLHTAACVKKRKTTLEEWQRANQLTH